MRTIVAVFSEIGEVEQTVERLVNGGFSRDDINIVIHKAKCGPALGPVPTLTSAGSLGAAAAVGGLGGFAAGVVALAIPGIGPILAAGPIAAELVAGGVGTLAGGVISWLRQMGVPDEDAGSFCEALRRGGIIVSVESQDERAPDAERLIGEDRLIEMDERSLEWHRQGTKDAGCSAQPSDQNPRPRGLPFDPERLRPSVRRQRAEQRAVHSYFRVS